MIEYNQSAKRVGPRNVSPHGPMPRTRTRLCGLEKLGGRVLWGGFEGKWGGDRRERARYALHARTSELNALEDGEEGDHGEGDVGEEICLLYVGWLLNTGLHVI